MKLLGSTRSKMAKDWSDENIPHLETNEVLLVHCNIVNNDYQQNLRVLYTFIPNKPFGHLLDISPKISFFKNLLILNVYILKYGLLIETLNC